MKGKSHIQLGKLLIENYLFSEKKLYRNAFLLGCIEPDRNPLTYLKGTIRCQCLRGHNYNNAVPFMTRIAARLERKQHWNLWDYYTAGKLMHYTADAFTYAHNVRFPNKLSSHNGYERCLQEIFLQSLDCLPFPFRKGNSTSMELIMEYHTEYSAKAPNVQTDCMYIFTVSCLVAKKLVDRGKE